ncbi:ribonuclease H-like domain-containing protein [Tanacetum coccineum]
MTPDQPPSYDFLLPPPNTQVPNPHNHHLSTGTPIPSIHIPTQLHPSQLDSTPHLDPTNKPVTLTEPTTPYPTPAPTSPGPTPNTHLTTPAATASSNAPNGPTTNTHHMVIRAKAGISKPLACMNCHVTTTLLIPRSHLHALRDPHWHKAMIDEYNALISNRTYKARLVANGHSQQQGIDCDETFNPVVKPTTIRTVLSLSVTRDWPIHQLDVKNAFLHGQLSETVYMHQPLGFVDSTHPDYGLDIAYLLLYVDDIVLTASSIVLLQRIITLLHAEILERAHIQHCNPCKTPMDTESKLGSDVDPISDPTLYCSLAGALQYLTFTRLDISYAVQQIFLYMHDPRDLHFNALKRILRYVRGTLDHGRQLHVSSASQLTAFTDADWSAKRQVTLSRSSAEAEYRGVANVVVETAWIRNLLLELHASLTTATLIYYDNVSAVYISTNPVQHQQCGGVDASASYGDGSAVPRGRRITGGSLMGMDVGLSYAWVADVERRKKVKCYVQGSGRGKSVLIATAEDGNALFLEPRYSPSSISVLVLLLIEEYGIPESRLIF